MWLPALGQLLIHAACMCSESADAREVTAVLLRPVEDVPGVVENGLFVDICDLVIIGNPDGRVELRDIKEGTITVEQISVGDEVNIFSDLN